MRACSTASQARLAASRNAKDDTEVDESLLNTGLFTYPVLQAADILAYKCVAFPSFGQFSDTKPPLEQRMYQWAKTKSSTSSSLVT